jgi:hypothetical protein
MVPVYFAYLLINRFVNLLQLITHLKIVIGWLSYFYAVSIVLYAFFAQIVKNYSIIRSSVCLQVSSPELLGGFRWNLVLEVYTKSCVVNLILIRIEQVSHKLYMKFKYNFSKTDHKWSETCRWLLWKW